MKRLLLLAVASLFLALGCSDDTPLGTSESAPNTAGDASAVTSPSEHRSHESVRKYEITVENLTPATGPGASQPFSPPVLASHRRGLHVFRPWRFATEEMILVAEDAKNGPLVDKLGGSRHVHAVVVGGGVILPGESASYEISTSHDQQFLSLVFMLVNTNDGFSGVDGLRPPRHGSRSYYLPAYDAGSEQNTELAAHIPGPCCGSELVGPDEHKRIRHHRGILGVGDLDASTYNWADPVAKLTITRID